MVYLNCAILESLFNLKNWRMFLLGWEFGADMIFVICASSLENFETTIAYKPLVVRALDQSDFVVVLTVPLKAFI